MRCSELKECRDMAFFKSYIEALRTQEFSTTVQAADYVRTHSAPCFFVSSDECSKLMTRMMAGDTLEKMRWNTRRRFKELFARFMNMKRDNPELPVYKICEVIVLEEAPEYYIDTQLALDIIRREAKRRYETMVEKYIK